MSTCNCCDLAKIRQKFREKEARKRAEQNQTGVSVKEEIKPSSVKKNKKSTEKETKED